MGGGGGGGGRGGGGVKLLERGCSVWGRRGLDSGVRKRGNRYDVI